MSDFRERRLRQMEAIGARLKVKIAPGLSPVWVSSIRFAGDTWTRAEGDEHTVHFKGNMPTEEAARLYHAPYAGFRMRFVTLLEWQAHRFPAMFFHYADILICKAGSEATVEREGYETTFLPEYDVWLIRSEERKLWR